MNPDIILYTLPQWFIFIGIIAGVYGWVEQKQIFRFISLILFILLAIYAAYTIYNGQFTAQSLLTPEEIINEEMGEDPTEELPLQARIFPAYILFIFSGLLAIPAFIFEWKGLKGKNLLMILTAFIALTGFFLIVGALKSI
jgi:hypothetical protein